MISSLLRGHPLKTARTYGHAHYARPHLKSREALTAKCRQIQRQFLTYVPHEFTIEEAAKRFAKEDQKRLFAPSPIKITSLVTQNLTGNPLKKVLIPIFGINAEIKSTSYNAHYGVNRVQVVTGIDGKTTTQVYTDWYSISGRIGSRSYNQEQSNMSMYGGLTWDAYTVEEAMEQNKISDRLLEFDPKNVDPNTVVDPFVIRTAIAQEIARERIYSREVSRIHVDIRDKVYCDTIRVNSYNVDINSFQLSYYLLPGYILQYLHQPPRIMPAFKDDIRIVGPGALSVPKCITAVAVGTLIVSLLFPQAALSVRILSVVASAALSGSFAHNKLYLQYLLQQKKIEKASQANESVSEMLKDKKRREETEMLKAQPHSTPMPFVYSQEDLIHLERLKIDPHLDLNRKLIQEAYFKIIKTVHPDYHPGPEFEKKTQEVHQSRSYLLRIEKKKSELYRQQKRYYSTQRTVKLPPRSVWHPQARELIDTVLVEKNYPKALQLVEVAEIHPDSHDQGENTLLTEAAKKGDIKALEFAIDKLRASPDTSCDCPVHMTALHYAVKNGHTKAVKLLLVKGANPNLINSHGNTPLDLAVVQKNSEMIQLLESYQAQKHNTLAGLGIWQIMKKFIGYRSNERTLLLEKPEIKQIPPKSKF